MLLVLLVVEEAEAKMGVIEAVVMGVEVELVADAAVPVRDDDELEDAMTENVELLAAELELIDEEELVDIELLVDEPTEITDVVAEA